MVRMPLWRCCPCGMRACMGWRVFQRGCGPLPCRPSAACLELGAADHLSCKQLTDRAASRLMASGAGARHHPPLKQHAQGCQFAFCQRMGALNACRRVGRLRCRCGCAGSLPVSWSQLPLQAVDVFNNSIGGSLPLSWASQTSRIWKLRLGRNCITGEAPHGICAG